MPERFTAARAQELLKLEKYIVDKDGRQVQKMPITVSGAVNLSFDLFASEDRALTFVLSIKQSKKNYIKITFQFFDKSSSQGLLRACFNGADHNNPEEVLDTLPDELKQHAGKLMPKDHLHIYVEGYETLAWAIPMEDSEFGNLKFNGLADFQTIFSKFAELINLKTTIDVAFTP
jgi:hypothetical protein